MGRYVLMCVGNPANSTSCQWMEGADRDLEWPQNIGSEVLTWAYIRGVLQLCVIETKGKLRQEVTWILESDWERPGYNGNLCVLGILVPQKTPLCF